jgi:hypothetical protein
MARLRTLSPVASGAAETGQVQRLKFGASSPLTGLGL